jgi:hypothetical protein
MLDVHSHLDDHQISLQLLPVLAVPLIISE